MIDDAHAHRGTNAGDWSSRQAEAAHAAEVAALRDARDAARDLNERVLTRLVAAEIEVKQLRTDARRLRDRVAIAEVAVQVADRAREETIRLAEEAVRAVEQRYTKHARLRRAAHRWLVWWRR